VSRSEFGLRLRDGGSLHELGDEGLGWSDGGAPCSFFAQREGKEGRKEYLFRISINSEVKQMIERGRRNRGTEGGRGRDAMIVDALRSKRRKGRKEGISSGSINSEVKQTIEGGRRNRGTERERRDAA
jgi:hypothetical protein